MVKVFCERKVQVEEMRVSCTSGFILVALGGREVLRYTRRKRVPGAISSYNPTSSGESDISYGVLLLWVEVGASVGFSCFLADFSPVVWGFSCDLFFSF